MPHRQRCRLVGIQRTIRRTPHTQHSHLPLQTAHSPIDKRFAQLHTHIADEKPRSKIVRTVHHHIIPSNQLPRILHRKPTLMSHHRNRRVELQQPTLRTQDLRQPHLPLTIQHLPLQVRHTHTIIINQANHPHPSTSQIRSNRRAQAPHTHHQHPRRSKSPLPHLANLRQNQLASITIRKIHHNSKPT